MICEQVKELLSAYLDDVLVAEEQSAVATHLETCQECTAALTDFRHFDTLLAQMPRVSPHASLRERIFSSPEYLELTRTASPVSQRFEQTVPFKKIDKKIQPAQQPELIALPGARDGLQTPSTATVPSASIRPITRTHSQKRGNWVIRAMQFTIAAAILLTLGIGGWITWNLQQRPATVASNASSFTPPANLQQGPIPAGTRFIFLRNGALWSAPTDTSSSIMRLTPAHITVAEHWTVKPPQAGHTAGDMLAYIDLQQGLVHLIRSDGQNDTAIQQPLLKHGVQPSTVWNTPTGTTILSSLAWSNDGNMLAFLADPQGTGQPGLYIYTLSSGDLHAVALPTTGAVLHPTWSPDSVRIAFTVTYNNKIDVVDYNTQSRDSLILSSTANTQSSAGDTILALNWSPDVATPAVTWNVGQSGHIHTLWLQPVSAGDTTQPTLLASGDYTQALYSQAANTGAGGWLLVTPSGDIINATLTSSLNTLIVGKQVSIAQWSPDGNSVDYFETLASNTAALHSLNISTETDSLIATNASTEPAPAWSADSRYLAYSVGSHVMIADAHTTAATRQLKQQGTVATFGWSVASPSQLVLATGNGPQQGLYLVDTQQNTSLQLDKEAINGPILWTQIS